MSNHIKDHFGRGVIGLVWSVWRVIFPLNRNFNFTKFGNDTEPKGRNTYTELTGYQLVRFYRFSVASNFLEQNRSKTKKKKKKEEEERKKKKEKSLFLFTFPHFLSTQTPSKPKKNLNHVYNQKHTKIRIYIYIFPLLSHVFSHPNTKHQAPSK